MQCYNLNFIAIDYRQELFKFKSYHYTKYFIKLGAGVCVCLCSGKREVNWSYFSFPIWGFGIKRKGKDAISVSSCYSVNWSINDDKNVTCNNIDTNSNNEHSFNFFSNELLNAKSNIPVYEGHINFRKKVTKSSQFAG